MPNRYAEIAFTDEVKAAQQHFGSRAGMARLETADTGGNDLTAAEQEFIAERDGFYLATASSSGWPYVQYRGGPAGFLHVLDEQTLAYADFRGNRQYITTGNLAGDNRASLFLMDYAAQRRLKIYGHLDVVDAGDQPALQARLTAPDYDANVERLVIVHVAAYNWNCPQHITPRYTLAEIQASMAPLADELRQLRAENARLKAELAER